jgi:hypothetical protein
LHEPDAFAARHQRVDSLGNGAGSGPHQHHDALGVGRTVIIHKAVASPGRIAEPRKRAVDDARHGQRVRVPGFARLEEHVRVLGASA